MTRATLFGLLFLMLVSPSPALADGDDFKTVVKTIERFYQVKHRSLPFIARTGIKTATAAARLAGGVHKQIAEAGSVRFVIFEDQEFKPQGAITQFRDSLNTALAPGWSPVVQTLAADAEQTYIYLRAEGEHFKVMVITLGRSEGVVVQVKIAPDTLARLLRDPNEMGKTITDDATTVDDQE